MQAKKEPQQKLSYNVGIERLVPQDHPVRRIKEVLDLRFLYKDTREFCSHEGNPSIDPVVLFKLCLIGYFFGIPSERRLFREVQVNLAYCWYLGYDLDEPIPDHSLMAKSRYQLPKEVFERLFKQIVCLCKEKELISGDYYFVDSSMVRADASKDPFRAKLRTEEEYLEELQAGDANRNNFKGYIFDGTVNPDKMGKRHRRQRRTIGWYLPAIRMHSSCPATVHSVPQPTRLISVWIGKSGPFFRWRDRKPPKTIWKKFIVFIRTLSCCWQEAKNGCRG